MMDNRNKIILEKLKTKACLKQKIFRSTTAVFENLKSIAKEVVNELADPMSKIDTSVEVSYTEINEFQFRIKFSGDTLIFQMHSNIVTLPPEDPIFRSSYMTSNLENRYFGSIRVYNFLSDSIKYSRLNDAGFLMARLLINRENHYHIEAEVYFEHLYPNIEKNIINDKNLRFFVQSTMMSAIDTDLIAPAYKDIQIVPLVQQLENSQGKAGSKLGFQMSHDTK